MTQETETPHARDLMTVISRVQGRYKVFVLTRDRGDWRHRMLKAPIPHRTSGRGSGFVKRQRYVSSHRLFTASSTADLDGD